MRILPLALAALVLLAGCAGPLDQIRPRPDTYRDSGALAMDYLGARHPNIVVEIDAVRGAEPNRAALADFEQVLEDLLGKPITVEVGTAVPGRGATHAYTTDDLYRLEREHRDRRTGGDTAVLHVLYLDGKFESEGALGVAYHGSAVAIFKGTIRANTRSDDQVLPTPSTLTRPREKFVERAVLIHEFGHILGLVNNGVPMLRPHEQTQDPVPETSENEGRKHSSNRESVMYWAVPTARVTHIFTSGEDIPWRFDADDRADVRAAKEAGSR